MDALRNVSAVLRRQAAARPDTIAWIDEARPDGLTYADLEAIVDAIAGRALDAGIRPGQRVAVALDPGLELIACMYAIARIGALSIDRVHPGDRCDACLAMPDRAESTMAATLRVTPDWLVPPGGGSAPAVPMHEGGATPFRICRTSGTTGRPKGVEMSHDMLIRRVAHRQAAFAWPSPGRLIAMIKPHAAYGLQVLHRALDAGGVTIDGPPIDRLHLALERHRVDTLVISPGVLAPFIEQLPADAGPFPSLAIVEVSGGGLSSRLAARASERVSPCIQVLFGSTESGLVAGAPWREIAGREGAAGRLLAGCDAEAIDPEGRTLARGVEGRLRVRGANAVSRYADGADSSNAFQDGWFLSGDFGRVDPDGVLVVAGRLDERINVGGAKIAPERLEHLVLAMPGIADVAAFSYPSSVGVDRVGLAIVTRPDFDFDAFQLRCRNELGVFSPGHVLQMRVIPRNASGKVERAGLARLVPAGATGAA